MLEDLQKHLINSCFTILLQITSFPNNDGPANAHLYLYFFKTVEENRNSKANPFCSELKTIAVLYILVIEITIKKFCIGFIEFLSISKMK